ncbi:MAG: DHH family phosphoesterase, partial [Duncaniella sp.]|nr:DHH family phosphoesterase [Duncaniella sp.]
MQNGRFVHNIDFAAATEVLDLIKESDKIVITCHVSPDGDAIGSSLGLWHTLQAMGKKATIVTPDCPPKILQFLPGVKEIVIGTRQTDYARNLLTDADLVFCMDFNDTKRVDKLQPYIDASSARKIVIDHHLEPVIEADLLISRT